MGYTHYYTCKKADQEVWNKIVADCKLVKKALKGKVQITGWDGEDEEPVFDENKITFNGVGDDSHETFSLERDPREDFNFTKTAHKPYDILVCACLVIYKVRSPETIELSSDGSIGEWREALALVGNVIGKEMSATFKKIMDKDMNM